MTTNDFDSSLPRPRLCHLRRWSEYPGYGFNLHSEKAKPGQYIGKVDANSPAESAGLLEHDRIVEVNFAPIGTENHKQVVDRIKEGVTRNGTRYPEEVILLVLDSKADEYYKSRSIIPTSSDPDVIKLETQSPGGKKNSDRSLNRDMGNGNSSSYLNQPKSNGSNRDYMNTDDSTYISSTNPRTAGLPASSNYVVPNYVRQDDPKTFTPPPYLTPDKDKRNHTVQPSSGNGSGGLLELQMSAAEYRAKLKQQNAHKRDPRHKPMSMKEKHDFIDSL